MLGILSAEATGDHTCSTLKQNGPLRGPALSGSNIFYRQTIHRTDTVNQGSSSLPDSATTEIRSGNASEKLLPVASARSHGRKAMVSFPIHGFVIYGFPIHGRKPAP